jgi:hypothetical protein
MKEENIQNNNLLKNLNISFDKKYCSREFKSDGKFKYLPLFKNNNFFYNRYYCIINKIKYSQIIPIPLLYAHNEEEIINQMLMLQYIIKKFNLIYFQLNNDNIVVINNDKKILNKVLTYYFIKYAYNNDKKFIQSITNTLIKKLSITFLYEKLTSSNKIKNETIFITIFFTKYIFEIKDEIYKKYKIKINEDFPNYNELYIFLKNKGYVTKYYNNYTKKILKTYKKIYKKIINHPDFNNYFNEQKKELKQFSSINIFDNYNNINSKFNKKYIKNKFIKLSKKYNI